MPNLLPTCLKTTITLNIQCNEGDEEDIEKIKKSSASRQQQSSMMAKNALSESHNAWLMSLSPAFAELPRFKALFVAKNKTELCLYVEQLHRPVELNVALNTVV